MTTQATRPNPPPPSVQRQVVLPFGKSVAISLSSIRVRFFRSLITMMTLVLAVSFLSFTLVSNDVAGGLLRSGDPELRQALIRGGYDVGGGDTGTRVDTGPRQRWLVFLSLLVCVIGIVNAQLMAVTERFREIGTMKCLGALDRFILRLFLIEAAIQGMAGAATGAVTGGLFALASGLVRFGGGALALLDLTDLAVSLAAALATGCVLSLMGVLYPAVVASRMQPVEAMRVEQ